MTVSTPLSVAIVGCGSVASELYLPSISALSDVSVTHAVDTNLNRARAVAREYKIPNVAASVEAVLDDVDAVIVTTPPAYHPEVAQPCLERGVHVLTEKPIATNPERAEQLVSIANDRDVHFAVMRNWRARPSLNLMKYVVDSGQLGAVTDISIVRANQLQWEYKSGYRFDEQRAGGGVLSDIGPHVLDTLFWFFGINYEIEWYADDSYGGLEANVELSLAFPDCSITASVTLSHTRDFPNRIEISGSEGSVEAPIVGKSVTINPESLDQTLKISYEDTDLPDDEVDRVGKQIAVFVESIRTDTVQYVSAQTGQYVVSCIDECYSRRETIVKPWQTLNVGRAAFERGGEE